MAVLLGNNATGTNDNDSDRGGDDAQWCNSTYTATAGTMVTFYVEMNAARSARYLKGCVWESDGTLLAASAPIQEAVGDQSGSITGTLVGSTEYYIGQVSDDYINIVSSDTTANTQERQDNNYATPTDITISGATVNDGTPRMWVEGTLGGTAYEETVSTDLVASSSTTGTSNFGITFAGVTSSASVPLVAPVGTPDFPIPYIATAPSSLLRYAPKAGTGEFHAGYVGIADTSVSPLLGRCAGTTADVGGFLDGDSDPDGDPISYEITTNVTHGTLTPYIGGAFVYVPDTDYVGNDFFQYMLHAGCDIVGPYNVNISVAGGITITRSFNLEFKEEIAITRLSNISWAIDLSSDQSFNASFLSKQNYSRDSVYSFLNELDSDRVVPYDYITIFGKNFDRDFTYSFSGTLDHDRQVNIEYLHDVSSSDQYNIDYLNDVSSDKLLNYSSASKLNLDREIGYNFSATITRNYDREFYYDFSNVFVGGGISQVFPIDYLNKLDATRLIEISIVEQVVKPATFNYSYGSNVTQYIRVFDYDFSNKMKNDKSINVEYKGNVESDKVIGISMVQTSQSDREIEISFQETLNSDKTLPVEFKNILESDKDINVSFSGNVEKDSTIGVNWFRNINSDRDFNSSWLADVSSDKEFEYNNRGVLSADKTMPYSFYESMTSDITFTYSNFESTFIDRQIDYNNRETIDIDRYHNIDFSNKLELDRELGIGWFAGLSVIVAREFSYEFSGSLDLDYVFPYDSSQIYSAIPTVDLNNIFKLGSRSKIFYT